MPKILTNREYKSVVSAYRRLQARCVKILEDNENRDYAYMNDGYDLSIFFDKLSNRVIANICSINSSGWKDIRVDFLPMELNNGADGAKAWAERYVGEMKAREKRAKAASASSERAYERKLARQERKNYEELKAKFEPLA